MLLLGRSILVILAPPVMIFAVCARFAKEIGHAARMARLDVAEEMAQARLLWRIPFNRWPGSMGPGKPRE